MSYNVGDTVVLDNIESVIIYDAGSEQEWGQYIVVDKNHDLDYYIRGTDYVDQSSSGSATDTHFAEWGGYGTSQGMGFTAYEKIGTGLSNTNTLISKNLQPDTSGWPVVWDWIEEFRSSHSNDWFLPSRQELNCVYNNSSLLNNISYNTNYYYWSSSEYNKNLVYIFNFRIGDETGNDYKSYHYNRSRLCRYTANTELNSIYNKKTWIDDEIITSTKLNSLEAKVKKKFSSYSPTAWNIGDVLSKNRLNKIETQLGSNKIWEDGNIVTAEDLNNIENLLS